MRGYDLAQPERDQVAGLSPCGSTCRTAPIGCCRRTHPRVRGEHLPAFRVTSRIGGSSPRARGSTHSGGQSGFRGGAHPRVRWEHRTAPARPSSAKGSSPRARGAQPVPPHRDVAAGLIPACAGSTTGAGTSPRCRWAHPRVRGEHRPVSGGSPAATGSSPRARGARVPARADRRHPGLIPACAGSTAPALVARTAPRAHPRVRGEHPVRVQAAVREGLIPACAGSTCCRWCCGRWSRAHPRVRGEHRCRRCRQLFCVGSSPRARGAPLRPARHPLRNGLIPACAGSTTEDCTPRPITWAHPRVRGEHIAAGDARIYVEGSSPRARGARHRFAHTAADRGLIPACAGSTLPDLHVLSPLPQFSFTFTQLTRRNPPPDTSHLRRPA